MVRDGERERGRETYLSCFSLVSADQREPIFDFFFENLRNCRYDLYNLYNLYIPHRHTKKSAADDTQRATRIKKNLMHSMYHYK